MFHRVVLDTNVVIRAMLSRYGASHKLFELAEENFDLFSSSHALKELNNKLALPRLSRRFETLVEIQISISRYRSVVTLLEPTIPIRACRDPDDDHFLSLAVSSNAKWLLTYDEDLLVLDPFVHQGIEVRIVRPEVFLEAMKEI
jgi:putative PIN family toxin of toxin-antitoxin system